MLRLRLSFIHIVLIFFCSRLLKDKRAMDESFNKFLEMKRGAAMHTLESLMLLPVSAKSDEA